MENLNDSDPLGDGSVDIIDETMLEWSDFISQMTEVDGYLRDDEMGTAMQLEKVEMSMPIQLDLHVAEDGRVILGGSPPLYYVDTTILPVFHQLSIKIAVTENTNSNAGSDE
jgi:hypothetical protein